MAAYYNEIDKFAAQWLRNLISAGHIAPGEVDERSIEDVRPDDLRGFTQCHFFAGIGVWSHSLRLAGWPDDREVWTGSCPCQPFSVAGKQKGFKDERHLWPAWSALIAERKPSVVFGEQVANPLGYSWLDSVWTDMEKAGYAFGPVVLPAAGFGAPHGRHRIFFVADSMLTGRAERGTIARDRSIAGRSETSELANTKCEQWDRDQGPRGREFANGLDVVQPERAGLEGLTRPKGNRNESGRIGAQENGSTGPSSSRSESLGHASQERCAIDPFVREDARGRYTKTHPETTGPGIANGFWRDAIWIECRDGKTRPIPTQPEFFPLAHGVASRVGKLRAYGNAIVAPVAAELITAFMESVS